VDAPADTEFDRAAAPILAIKSVNIHYRVAGSFASSARKLKTDGL